MVGGNFHSIIYTILNKDYGMDHQSISRMINDDDKLMDILLSKNPPVFDAIIIDEAQDFSGVQFEIVELMLSKDGIFYCFWDNNQRLLRADFNISDTLQPFHLDMNLRNTQKIFNEVKKYYYQINPIFNNGPEGQEVKVCPTYNSLRAKDLKQKLSTEILELIHKEGVKPRDITVLTFKSKEQSILTDFVIPGIKIDAFSNNADRDSLIIETVRRFKGLESSVVILTELDDYSAINNKELWDNLCYVAMSRARNYLVVLPSDNIVLGINE